MKRVLGILLVLIAWVSACNSSKGGESPVVPLPSPPISRDFPLVVDFGVLPEGPINPPVTIGDVVVDGEDIQVEDGAVTITLGTLEVTSPADFRQAAVLVKEMTGSPNTVIEGLDSKGGILTMTTTGTSGDYYYVRLLGPNDGIRKVRVSGQHAKVKKMILARPFQTIKFTSEEFISSSGTVSRIATADFNNDSFADLAVADSITGDVTVLFGNGTGDFLQSEVLSIGVPAIDIEPVDINGDDFVDLLTLGNNELTVFLNDGAHFNSSGVYIFSSQPYDMAVGDFDQDTLPDVAVASQNGLYLMKNLGAGVFGAAQLLTGGDIRAVAITDMNGDFHRDIVLGKAAPDEVVEVWLGDGLGVGAGNFSLYGTNPLLSTPVSIAAIGFDWDDYPDVATLLAGSPNWQTFINDGTGTLYINQAFQATKGTASQFVISDIHNDGFADMAVLDITFNEIDVFVSDLVGNFIIADRESIGSTPTALAAGDINNDRRTDLIFSVVSGKVWIYENTSH